MIPAARAITAMSRLSAEGQSPAPKAWGYLRPDQRLMWCVLAKVDEYNIASDWDVLGDVAKTKLMVSTMVMLELFMFIGTAMEKK